MRCEEAIKEGIGSQGATIRIGHLIGGKDNVRNAEPHTAPGSDDRNSQDLNKDRATWPKFIDTLLCKLEGTYLLDV